MTDALKSLIIPDWPAPSTVHALCTTRSGGHSRPPFDTFNLAAHVGDDPQAVAANRRSLRLQLPDEPIWLTQVHGTRVIDIAATPVTIEADAGYTRQRGTVCAVLTADCLPLLLCDKAGSVVAAVHAGWRGLAAGVIESALQAMATPGHEILAWLGPAIGPRAFEVGVDVLTAFIAADPAARDAFTASPRSPGQWMADLYALARLRLAAAGVDAVYGGHECTFSDPVRFFSYRRSPQTGRMASVIWLA